MNVLVKLFGILETAQRVLKVVVPALEEIIKADINGDGKIGR